MSEHMVPVLPLDIIEDIVEILINDHQGLQYVKKFSLICQSALPLCRKHIFSSIRMFIGSDLKELHTDEAFRQLLLETPEIAKYIRRLDIGIRHLSESLHLFDYVPQLTRLQSLAVSHLSNFQWRPMDWNNIPSSIQRSLLALIHLPTIIHLTLRWMRNFPISSLITCTNLKYISARELYVTGEHDEVASSLSREPMQLQALDIKLTSAAAEGMSLDGWLLLDFTFLEKICVEFSRTHTSILMEEIFRKSPHLSDISLTVPETSFRSLELAKTVTPLLKTLRRVHLAIRVYEESEDPLAGLCDELEEILGMNKLESIEIQIKVQTDEECRTGDEWGRLEKTLLKPGWPMLKRVSLAIIIYSFLRKDNSPFEVALKDLPQTQFTGLMSSKNFLFHFSVQNNDSIIM